jgi:hypothetical protein
MALITYANITTTEELIEQSEQQHSETSNEQWAWF